MTGATRIFPEATIVLDMLLDGLDTYAPGLITACHVTGSIALGEGRSGQSDIDLVLVRDGAASDSKVMVALEPVLAELRVRHPRPPLDGMVLTAADLEAGPDRIAGERPVIVESRAEMSPGGSGRNPVTWHTLRQCGITWRGEPLDAARLWHDPARLDAWTRENLTTYWRSWLGQTGRLAARPDMDALIDEATEWCVLGVTRLHDTLATGEITSKHGAGRYALETFPARWHPIVEEALRIRERRDDPPLFTTPLARLHEVRAYVAMVIDDALALPVCDAVADGFQR